VRWAAASAVAAAICAAPGVASAPPVGHLPNGPTTTVRLKVGKSYTARLPKAKVAGRVWRIARPFTARIIRETGEGETKNEIWIRFRAAGKGTTLVVFAMTLGERSHAYAAHTYRFVVN
jgi:hypothetical protein